MTAEMVDQRPALVRMLRSERIKLTSTNTWWIVAIVIIVSTAIALSFNLFAAATDLSAALYSTDAPADAIDVVTSGQYAGALCIMLLSILMIANEFRHQTATATFLATPKRTTVIAGKFTMAMLLAGGIWFVTEFVDLVSATLFYQHHHGMALLKSAPVERAIVVNLMIYLLWAAFGVGIGTLIRSQIGATITSLLIYTTGVYVVEAIAYLFYLTVWHSHHVYQVLILIPGFAGGVAMSPGRTTFHGVSFFWWEGAIVMVAYGAAMIAIGTSDPAKARYFIAVS